MCTNLKEFSLSFWVSRMMVHFHPYIRIIICETFPCVFNALFSKCFNKVLPSAFKMDSKSTNIIDLVLSIIKFQWVSYQAWSNQAKMNEVQDRLVGWNHKEKRNHSDSRRELYFFCQPNNEDVAIYLYNILHYEVWGSY